jgi:WD40 repeat protein
VLLAAASAENTIRVYDTGEKKLDRLLKGHRGAVRSLSFHPGGRFLLSASEDQSLILWDLETGDRIHTFLGEWGACLETRFYPDGRRIATVYADGSLVCHHLDPEIFVWRYYPDEFASRLKSDSLFLPRQQRETRKEFRDRQEEAERRRAEIVRSYFNQLNLEL